MRESDRREWRMGSGEWTAAIRRSPLPVRQAVLVMALGGNILWLSACGISFYDSSAGFSCIDDSAHCVAQREATLKAMLADEKRKWVREAPTQTAYASGVRLFAFRSSKAELSCEELSVGRREAQAAPKVLKGGTGLSPAQVSRASLFAAEVQKELAAEMRRRRCRA